MHQRPAIITDIDNTLYNFVDFFGPAFRAMLHVLSAKLGLCDEELIESFREVYSRHQNLEYKFSIQELAAIQRLNLSDESMEKLIHTAKLAFGQSRRIRLKLYPHVKETLTWLKTQGYVLVAYTDGQVRYSENRLQHLGILSCFDAVVGWGPILGGKSAPIHLNREDLSKWFVDVETEGPRRLPDRIVQNVGLDERKPNPTLLRSIITDMKLDADRSWLVGDSPVKDLAPAKEVGLHDVWAKYGKVYDERNWNTLVSVSPWAGSTIRHEADTSSRFTPSHVIDDFSDLRKIVPALQSTLF